MEMIAAMQAFLDALDARLKAVEGRPDANVEALRADLAATAARVIALEAFDKRIIDL
jgi:hypothetical protein